VIIEKPASRMSLQAFFVKLDSVSEAEAGKQFARSVSILSNFCYNAAILFLELWL